MVKLTKIKGSSLVEVTVSLVIIMMVFAFSLMIYLNVTKSTISPELQLKLFLQDYALKSKREKLYTNEEVVFGEYIIRREVIPYQGNTDLLLCSYIAEDQEENLITQRREIVYVGESNN